MNDRKRAWQILHNEIRRSADLDITDQATTNNADIARPSDLSYPTSDAPPGTRCQWDKAPHCRSLATTVIHFGNPAWGIGYAVCGEHLYAFFLCYVPE